MSRVFSLGVVVLLLVAGTASALFVCDSRQPTFRQELANASIVVHGVLLESSKVNNTDEFITPFEIKSVIKKHAIIDKVKIINIPREINIKREPMLVFGDVFKGTVDLYRAVPATEAIVPYMRKIVDLKGKKEVDCLRFYFDHLEDKEKEITEDAYREFGNADDKHLALLAKNLPADQIAGWLDNIHKTGARKYRSQLYAHLLGLTGQTKHAPLLKKMIDAKDGDLPNDGLLLAYTLLLPKEGWEAVAKTARTTDDKVSNFPTRYGALRAARHLREKHAELWSKEKRDSLNVYLEQADIVDLWIEELRRMQAWDLTDRVLDVWSAKAGAVNIVKRSILRFALCSPTMRAQAFIREQRQRDAEYIREIEELLELEAEPKN
jgi:hypothetical protein